MKFCIRLPQKNGIGTSNYEGEYESMYSLYYDKWYADGKHILTKMQYSWVLFKDKGPQQVDTSLEIIKV